MKLYLKGHDYKYATEQMLPAPRDVPSRGDPFDSTSSAEMNSACGKVLALGQNAWVAPFGAGVSSLYTGRRP